MLIRPYVKKLSSIDNRIEAWKTSRPDFDFTNFKLDDIGNMDISLNSMKIYTFEIRSSIFFRDLLFSMRPIYPWAQSLRSRPMERKNLIISSEYGYVKEHDDAIDKAISLLKDGVPQDIVREYLPMALSTAYTVAIDLRTLIGFLKMINEIDFLRKAYSDLFINQLDDAKEFFDSKVKSFKDIYCLTKDERLNNYSSHHAGEMIYGNYMMKSALTSQFIRKHNAFVKTSLWTYAYEDAFDFYQDDFFLVIFYMLRDQYRRMIQLRSHWFTDWSNDMWGKIVGDYISDLNIDEFWNFIPNGAGKEDPYFGDTISRVTGEEKSIPCPIMCEAPYLIDKRYKELGENPVILRYLELKEKGYIKDNPNNKYRLMYEALL